jgi:hypothetical protein
MIAKRITSKAATSRIARLVRYVVAAEGGIDPRSWARTADYMLCSGTSNRGEKVGGVRVTNCNTDDPAAATTLIEVTQAVNTRSKTDKTYHLVFSFPPGEEPALHILHKIEDELVKAIGFEQHQRISAVHIDRDHLHVHVAINKVHPTGFQNIEPYFDKMKLMEACERLEIEYGLTRTNHGLTGEMTKAEKAKIRSGPAQAEAHSGLETLIGHVSRDVAPAMHKAKSWQELHGILAKHGLQIKPRGAGLVIGNGKIWAKASQCDRSLSMKSLADKFGPFEKAKHQKEFKPYEPKPRQQHHSSADLYAKYQHEREVAKVVRKNELAKLKYEAALQEVKLKKWHIAQRLIIKTTGKGPKRRAMLKIAGIHTQALRNNNRSAADTRRKAIINGTAMPSWAQWLIQQAQDGNSEALAVLRSRKQREAMRGNILTANKQTDKCPILHGMKAQADKDGLVTYRTEDGGMVIDRKTHVQAFRTTAGSAIVALELAARRYEGQTLIIEGQDQFKSEVAKLAKERGIKVRFAVPTKEQHRGIEL